MRKKWLTVAEAADALKIRAPRLRVWIRDGRVTATVIRAGKYAIKRIAMDEIKRVKTLMREGLPV